jgi:hypothetical protein
VNVLCVDRATPTYTVAAATVVVVITTERQGSLTVSTNDVVPVGVYTMPARAIEFTCTVYTPTFVMSAKGPAVYTPEVETV